MPINHSPQQGTHVLDILWLHFILPMKIGISHTCLTGKENSNVSIFAVADEEMVSNQSVELKGKKMPHQCYPSVKTRLVSGPQQIRVPNQVTNRLQARKHEGSSSVALNGPVHSSTRYDESSSMGTLP